jgi:hypothetical protein
MKTYAELLKRTDAPPGSSWGLFGPDDELGMLNFLTPEKTKAAARLVRRGDIFNLDCALDAFKPPIAAHRHDSEHKIFGNSPHHRDDYLNGFYLQSSTQLDGFRHYRHPRYGFYNGKPDESVAVGEPTLGIHRLSERGIVGRGVLIDIPRFLEKAGRQQLDHREGEAFPVSLLDEAAQSQGVAFASGDILIIRTGWLDYYFNQASDTDRAALPGKLRSPGLVQGHETLAWLWDHQLSVVAADNAGLEAIPAIADSPLIKETVGLEGVSPRHAGLMHPYLIAMLGVVIGELWDAEALAADCAADGIYEFLVSSKPLNLVGGVGSPANAMAVK